MHSGSPSSRTTWSPSKLKKVQQNEARLNPVLGGLPPNEVASGIIAEGMNSPIKHFRMINVKEHADAQFNIGGNLLYAHRCVVNTRCPALFTKFVKEKQIKKGITYIKVDDKQIDDPTLYAILHYLYSDELLFHTVEPAQVVNLLRASQQYELTRLAWLSERYLKSIITMDNFFVLLKVAASGTVVRAKTLCMEFGAKHFKELIVRKDGVTSLGLDLFREFVEFVVIPDPKRSDVDPETKSLPSTIEEDFTKIYNEMSFTDGSALLAGDKQPVRFHSAFLLETAPGLSIALTPSKDSSEEHREQSIIDFPKNFPLSAGAFRALLRFIYYSDKSIEPVHAAELVPFGRHYEIPPLSETVESIVKTGVTVGSVIPILGLCYNKDVAKLVKNDVYNPSLKFLLAHFTEVDFKPLKKKSAHMAFDILRLCKKQIEDGKWKHGDGSASYDDEATESFREVSESEDRKRRKDKEKEADDEYPKDALSPMRDGARASSPRLNTSSKRLEDTGSIPNSPATEEGPRRTKRKFGKTKSLIEPSVRDPEETSAPVDFSHVAGSGDAHGSSRRSRRHQEGSADAPSSPVKASEAPAAEATKPAEEASAKPAEETKKPEDPKAEETKRDEEPKKPKENNSAEESAKSPEQPKADDAAVPASEQPAAEKAPEKKADAEKDKPAETAAAEKAESKPAEEAANGSSEGAATEGTEKLSKRERRRLEAEAAEKAAEEEAARAAAERRERRERRKSLRPTEEVPPPQEEKKRDKTPKKEKPVADEDSDSSRAAIKDKIAAFETQAKANAEKSEAEKSMVRSASRGKANSNNAIAVPGKGK